MTVYKVMNKICFFNNFVHRILFLLGDPYIHILIVDIVIDPDILREEVE